MVLLDVYGADGSLFVNGVPLSIKGVNWFGSESYGGPPGGLTEHTIDFYLDFLQQHKFNALRLLFNHQSVAAATARAQRWREARQAGHVVWRQGTQGTHRQLNAGEGREGGSRARLT